MSEPCARWSRLSDGQAVEEPLSEEQLAFLREHPRRCPTCAAERALWGAMEGLLDGAAAGPSVKRERVVSAPSFRARRWSVALLGAAGLLFALLSSRGLRVTSPAPAATRSPAQHRAALERSTGPLAPGAQLTATHGEVELDGQVPKLRESLRSGALLQTRRGRACLRVEPGVRVCVNAFTSVRIGELSATRRRLQLLAGHVAAELAPQPAGTSFGVETQTGSAVAVGTSFSVEVPREGGVFVTRVTHGTVVVRAESGREQRVEAGQRTFAAASVEALPEREAELDRALLAPSNGELGPLQERGRSAEPSEAARPPRTPIAASVRRVAGKKPRAHDALESAERARAAAQLLVLARDARARGDVGLALSAYRSLFSQHGDTREARAARVAYGQLVLASEGDPALALAAFDLYLQRPGPLGEEASHGRVRALHALGRQADEAAAIELFVRNYPDSALTPALRERARRLEAP